MTSPRRYMVDHLQDSHRDRRLVDLRIRLDKHRRWLLGHWHEVEHRHRCERHVDDGQHHGQRWDEGQRPERRRRCARRRARGCCAARAVIVLVLVLACCSLFAVRCRRSIIRPWLWPVRVLRSPFSCSTSCICRYAPHTDTLDYGLYIPARGAA